MSNFFNSICGLNFSGFLKDIAVFFVLAEGREETSGNAIIGAVAGGIILIILLTIYTVIMDGKESPGGCSVCICKGSGESSCKNIPTDELTKKE